MVEERRVRRPDETSVARSIGHEVLTACTGHSGTNEGLGDQVVYVPVLPVGSGSHPNVDPALPSRLRTGDNWFRGSGMASPIRASRPCSDCIAGAWPLKTIAVVAAPAAGGVLRSTCDACREPLGQPVSGRRVAHPLAALLFKFPRRPSAASVLRRSKGRPSGAVPQLRSRPDGTSGR